MSLRSALSYLDQLRKDEEARLDLLFTEGGASHETLVAQGESLGYSFSKDNLTKAFLVYWEMTMLAHQSVHTHNTKTR